MSTPAPPPNPQGPSAPTTDGHAVAPAQTPGAAGLTTLAVSVAIIAALYIGRNVFIPIVLAILLSFVLVPLVELLRRLRIGRVAAVIVAVLLALGVISGIAVVIGMQVAALAQDFPRYQATVTRKVYDLQGAVVGRAANFIKRLDRQIDEATKPAATGAGDSAKAPKDAAVDRPLPVEVHEREPSSLVMAQRILGPALQPVATMIIVLIVAIFILMQREDLRDRMIRLFGARDLHRTTVALDDAARRLSKYFLTQLALNTAFGVLITIGLTIIGVPSPLLWGVFAGLMRFVPYVGSFLAGAAPVALAAAVDPTGWSMALWTLALFAISEPVMGHFVEPMVYGHSIGLSSFAVVVAAIFWTWLWGPIGLILSTPFTVILVVLGRHVPRLEFLDVMLGDRPALTPIESFYQRMLAGDPDEALEQAEALLKDRSLSSYYDEVALKGLQLAANDAGRDVVTPTELETIRRSISQLVNDLVGYDDVEPSPQAVDTATDPAGPTLAEKELPKTPPLHVDAPPADELPARWRAERAILCVAGRGPLDEGVTAMLAQLLVKHGLGAAVLPHRAVSRDDLGALDIAGVAMVCISYLDIGGRPAHLRYLLRRLRARVGADVPILVGLWPADDQVLTDPASRNVVGADHYVVTLRVALKVCLEAAHAAAEAPASGRAMPA
ncbi:MAG TPA: AI-2E family transporter [Casimicrobiaceae bacterium]|nr:AI-2E family transporter [Casimicrobiaceae bacterium]